MKPVLVFIHGWGSSVETWDALLSRLGEGYDIRLIALPGFRGNIPIVEGEKGSSKDNKLREKTYLVSAGEGELTARYLVEAIAAYVPAQSFLIGWSLGGMLATELARQFPKKVRGLITLAANLKFVNSNEWPWAMPRKDFDDFYSGLEKNPGKTIQRFTALQSLGDRNRKHVLKNLNDTSSVFDEADKGVWQQQLQILNALDNTDVGELACPGLHLYAENDSLVPVSAVEHVYANSSKQGVEIIKNCGHAIHLSEPDVVATRIQLFVNKHAQGKAGQQKTKISSAFSLAASGYDQYAVLQREIAQNLVARCNAVRGRVLDLGCGTGFVGEALAMDDGELFLLDISRDMLKQSRKKMLASARGFTAADMDALPFADNSFDFILSSMSIQWTDSSDLLFKEIYRVLKPSGRCLFSTVGPETLTELREAWSQVDNYIHINPFTDPNTLQASAAKAGFKVFEHNVETSVVQHESVIQLMRGLKNIGAHTVKAGQNRGLTAKKRLQKLQEAYEKYRTQTGLLPATWQIIYIEAQCEKLA